MKWLVAALGPALMPAVRPAIRALLTAAAALLVDAGLLDGEAGRTLAELLSGLLSNSLQLLL